MAESILLNVATSLITKLGSHALTECQLFCGVDDELSKLKQTILDMKAVLHDAEEQQSNSETVENWVSRVKDAFYDVDDLIDEFAYETLRRQVMAEGKRWTKEVCQVFSIPHQIAFRFKMSHKIKDIREKLKAIDADKNQFNFYECMINTQDDELRKSRETSPFIFDDEVVGRDDNKKAIIDLLTTDTNVKENVAVIAIVGMGGLGKTTLAQSVYNNENTTKHFELKLWVCISEEFDVKVIVEKIIESVIRKKPEILQMGLLQSELRRHIDGKKYLLVMDDVWNKDHEKWVNLKRSLMGGAPGSRILITTRDQQVAETFDTTSLYPLGVLDDQSAWLLFKKMAFGGEELEKEIENSNLVEIGKEIVGKLKGLPLAIRTIGRLLYNKKPEHHLWLAFKDKELSQVLEQREEAQFMLSILKLSYNHLRSNLKQCFLYCALFPKDYHIQKDEVIKQWVAQGFVQSNGTVEPNDIGEEYFNELLSRSFFQDVTRKEMDDITECKMHDLIHDLACSIVKKEYVSMDVNDSIDIERTRHISVDCSYDTKLESLKLLFEAKNLRTLMVEVSSRKDFQQVFNLIPTNFLRLRTLSFDWRFNVTTKALLKSIGKLKHLRYLKMEIFRLSFLPDSITELYNLETLILDECSSLQELPRDAKNWMKLRYLSLANNQSLKFLPDSIVALHNLGTLILRDCVELKELPKDIKKCINLKHLDLRGCNALTHLPKGLGELTNLQVMNFFVLKKDVGCDLSELNRLSKLRGSLTIEGLEVCTTDDLEKNSFNLRPKWRVQELILIWKYVEDEPMNIALDNDHKGVLEFLQPHSSVRKIHICGYQEVKLCDWLSSNILVHLVSIELSDCFKLEALPQFDQFPSLKRLGLKSLPFIEYIDNNNSPSSSMFFPSLETLRIEDMRNLKGWWKGKTSSESSPNSVSFPTTMSCLCELQIHNCPQLASIPRHAPLQKLELEGISSQLLNMVIETSSHCGEESSSTLSSFWLGRIEDLEFLPKELFYHFTNLKSLVITNCNNLQMSSSLVQHLINEVLWKEFRSLSSLYLIDIPKLEYLPNGMQHVTTLQHIFIHDCENLVTIPEWIGNLTSLSHLYISGSPKLTSLPEGIQHLCSLQHLKIWNCPKLLQRYEKGKGEDWQKISHISEVDIS